MSKRQIQSDRESRDASYALSRKCHNHQIISRAQTHCCSSRTEVPDRFERASPTPPPQTHRRLTADPLNPATSQTRSQNLCKVQSHQTAVMHGHAPQPLLLHRIDLQPRTTSDHGHAATQNLANSTEIKMRMVPPSIVSRYRFRSIFIFESLI